MEYYQYEATEFYELLKQRMKHFGLSHGMTITFANRNHGGRNY